MGSKEVYKTAKANADAKKESTPNACLLQKQPE